MRPSNPPTAPTQQHPPSTRRRGIPPPRPLSRRTRWLIAAAPFVYLLHDLEEARAAEQTNELVRERFPAWFAERFMFREQEMLRAAAAAFVFSAALSFAAARANGGSTARRLVVVVAGLRLVNGGQHTIAALAFRRYVAGVATAPVLSGHALLLFRSLSDDGAADRGALARSTAVGGALIAPSALALRAVARLSGA